jgi:membrane protease YdiL (CAAX protease family)
LIHFKKHLDFSTGLWPYFGLTFGWSLFFWGMAVLMGAAPNTFQGNLLLILGGGGPPIAAIALTLRDKDPVRRRDYWQRIVDFKRIPPRWFGVIFLVAPLTSLLAALTYKLWTGEAVSFPTIAEYAANPLGLLPFALGILLFGPLPEELGWRGYALDRLQARWNGLASSLILAVVWGIWHLPLFLIPGTYQNEMGFGSLRFWLFMASLIPETILISWVFNHTRRSTLAAILFHFMTNFTGQLLDPSPDIGLYRLLWVSAIAMGVISITGKELKRKNNLAT